MTYPAHHDLSMHEIPDRTGDPLVTGDRATVEMLVRVAYNAYRQMGSTHNAAPCAQALSKRIMNPKPGDPVYVPDSLRRRASEDDREKGIGYLVVRRVEWTHAGEQWAEVGSEWTDYGSPRPHEEVFYVQYGPAPVDICRWGNASVLAIPYSDEMMREVDEEARRIVDSLPRDELGIIRPAWDR